MRVVTALVAVCITIPIWFYLLYEILVRINANELMWFLFWVYVPFALFVGVMLQILKEEN